MKHCVTGLFDHCAVTRGRRVENPYQINEFEGFLACSCDSCEGGYRRFGQGVDVGRIEVGVHGEWWI